MFERKLVFLVDFKAWDLSRKMRRVVLTEFSSGIIDFENKNISIVQKQWKFRISLPMSYVALGHHSQIAMEPNSASSAMVWWPNSASSARVWWPKLW